MNGNHENSSTGGDEETPRAEVMGPILEEIRGLLPRVYPALGEPAAAAGGEKSALPRIMEILGRPALSELVPRGEARDAIAAAAAGSPLARVNADPDFWVAALERLLLRLKESGLEKRYLLKLITLIGEEDRVPSAFSVAPEIAVARHCGTVPLRWGQRPAMLLATILGLFDGESSPPPGSPCARPAVS